MFEEFRKFAMRGSVIDLSVGVVIGAAFTAIVNSLVKDVLTPPLGVLMGGIDFSNFFVVLRGAHLATLKATQDAGGVAIAYGQFVNTIINFLIIALALFLVLRQINRLTQPKAPPPAVVAEEVQLLREIRDTLKARA